MTPQEAGAPQRLSGERIAEIRGWLDARTAIRADLMYEPPNKVIT